MTDQEAQLAALATNVLRVACPHCDAPIGASCDSRQGHAHSARHRVAPTFDLYGEADKLLAAVSFSQGATTNSPAQEGA